jgi:hypothetical protein
LIASWEASHPPAFQIGQWIYLRDLDAGSWQNGWRILEVIHNCFEGIQTVVLLAEDALLPRSPLRVSPA